MSMADKFCGKVQENEYTQLDNFSAGMKPGIVIGQGTPQNIWYRDSIVRKTKEQTFRFEGLTYAEAHSNGSINVVDVEGASYTVPLESSFHDASTGTLVMCDEKVQVSRGKMSPHMWWLEVRREGSAFYINGTQIFSGPAWAQ